MMIASNNLNYSMQLAPLNASSDSDLEVESIYEMLDPKSLVKTNGGYDKLLCVVCEGPADGQHFNAEACRACAAFFRRTISNKLRYVCRFNDNCSIKNAYRSFCRSCRLKKCFAGGMKSEAVRGPSTQMSYIYPPSCNQESIMSKVITNDWMKETRSRDPTLIIGSVIFTGRMPEDKIQKPITNDLNNLQLARNEKKRTLIEIVNFNSVLATFWHEKIIPQTHPILTKMTFCYDHFQKQFWIHFFILERNFETFQVLGPSVSDNRMIFSYGDIIDVYSCVYNLTNVVHEKKEASQPWFRLSVKELLPYMRKIKPTEMEMMFCFAVMLWKYPAQMTSSFSDETQTLAHQMLDRIYDELEHIYTTEKRKVKRIVELMELITITHNIVLRRREDIIVSRTFNFLKIDLYMEELFGTAS